MSDNMYLHFWCEVCYDVDTAATTYILQSHLIGVQPAAGVSDQATLHFY